MSAGAPPPAHLNPILREEVAARWFEGAEQIAFGEFDDDLDIETLDEHIYGLGLPPPDVVGTGGTSHYERLLRGKLS